MIEVYIAHSRQARRPIRVIRHKFVSIRIFALTLYVSIICIVSTHVDN